MKPARTSLALIGVAVLAAAFIPGRVIRGTEAAVLPQNGSASAPFQREVDDVSLASDASESCVTIGVPDGSIVTIESVTVQVSPAPSKQPFPVAFVKVEETSSFGSATGKFVPVPRQKVGSVLSGSIETLLHLGVGIDEGLFDGNFAGSVCLNRNGATGAFSMAYVVSGFIQTSP